jgi:hypothetical protein
MVDQPSRVTAAEKLRRESAGAFSGTPSWTRGHENPSNPAGEIPSIGNPLSKWCGLPELLWRISYLRGSGQIVGTQSAIIDRPAAFALIHLFAAAVFRSLPAAPVSP